MALEAHHHSHWWPEVRPPGKKAHGHTAEGPTRHHHRDSVCPAHKGVAGNEKADEWARIAAEEPDTRGVE